MLQINIHCHICFGLRLLPKNVKNTNIFGGGEAGVGGLGWAAESGPSVQLVKYFITSKERNHNEGKSPRGRKKRNNSLRRLSQPRPWGPSGAVLGGSIPGITPGLGTAVAVQGCPFSATQSILQDVSQHLSAQDWETDQQQQDWDVFPVSGMLHHGLAVLAAPRELLGGCACAGNPCPAQLCLAVLWWPCLGQPPHLQLSRLHQGLHR